MSHLAAPAVDLVIPTYDSPELLRACLRALRRMEYRDYRLIVVDDCGERPALPIVQQEHPGAIVLRARRNRGLVRAFNRGIAHGTAPYVALLNDDTEVDAGWLGALVECAERHPEAGSVASKMLLHSDPGIIHSCGDGFGVWGMPFNRGVWLPDLGQYDAEGPVFSACGGAALYRRAALEAVRLAPGVYFDPRLWMYLEDVELGWRLQLAGYPCIYQPRARVLHHLSATGGGPTASYYVSRNIWHVLLRTMPRPLLRRHLPRIVAHHLGRNYRHLRSVRSPAARASLRGTLAGLITIPTRADAAPGHVPPRLDGLLAR